MNDLMFDKAKGCLIGLAVGDALGVPSEGKTPSEINSEFGFIDDFINENPSGSDDTEFAIFNAMILLEYGLQLDEEVIAREWIKHILPRKGQLKGAGFSERMAIENLRKGLKPPFSGMHAHGWSDGLAMRIAPFGIVCPGNPDKASELSLCDGSVTHSGEGIFSGMAVSAAISQAMVSNDLEVMGILDLLTLSFPSRVFYFS